MSERCQHKYANGVRCLSLATPPATRCHHHCNVKRKTLSIAAAKRLARDLGADGVLIIAVTGSRIVGASYGRDKQRCAALGRLLDEWTDDLGEYGIVGWPDEDEG